MATEHETFQIEDKTALTALVGTEKLLVQQADSTYRSATAQLIATEGFTNTIFVSQESDFGIASGGTITLLTGTVYILLGTVVMSNTLTLPPIGGLTAFGATVGVIIYTGTGTFFNGPAIDGWTLDKFIVVSTSGSATLFNITGAPVTFPAFWVLDTLSFNGFANLGTYTSVAVRHGNVGMIAFGTGLTITNTTVCQIIGSLYQNTVAATTPFISFAGTHNLIQMKDGNYQTLATEEVLFIDPAIIVTTAIITGNVFRNSTSSWFAAGSLLENDIRFTYADNGDGPESAETANMFISASAGTVIGTPGTFIMVNGTYTAETTKRFTHSAGVLTYTGRKPRTFLLMASVSFISSANNREVDLRVAKNGTSDANSNQRRKIGSGADVGNISILHELDLVTGDTVELQWSTAVSTTTLTATFMNFIIN